jgi:hypothetical protein
MCPHFSRNRTHSLAISLTDLDGKELWIESIVSPCLLRRIARSVLVNVALATDASRTIVATPAFIASGTNETIEECEKVSYLFITNETVYRKILVLEMFNALS